MYDNGPEPQTINLPVKMAAEEILKTLRVYGWTKRMMINPHTNAMCVLGANQVLWYLGNSGFLRKFADTADEQFPDRSARQSKDICIRVATFNDHPLTTFPDIEMILEKIIAG